MYRVANLLNDQLNERDKTKNDILTGLPPRDKGYRMVIGMARCLTESDQSFSYNIDDPERAQWYQLAAAVTNRQGWFCRDTESFDEAFRYISESYQFASHVLTKYNLTNDSEYVINMIRGADFSMQRRYHNALMLFSRIVRDLYSFSQQDTGATGPAHEIDSHLRITIAQQLSDASDQMIVLHQQLHLNEGQSSMRMIDNSWMIPDMARRVMIDQYTSMQTQEGFQQIAQPFLLQAYQQSQQALELFDGRTNNLRTTHWPAGRHADLYHHMVELGVMVQHSMEDVDTDITQMHIQHRLLLNRYGDDTFSGFQQVWYLLSEARKKVLQLGIIEHQRVADGQPAYLNDAYSSRQVTFVTRWVGFVEARVRAAMAGAEQDTIWLNALQDEISPFTTIESLSNRGLGVPFENGRVIRCQVSLGQDEISDPELDAAFDRLQTVQRILSKAISGETP